MGEGNGKDKRHFHRYRKGTTFVIKIKNIPFKATTADYSLSGLSAFIEDSPPVEPGDIVDINIEELDIHQEGKIVWVKRQPKAVKIGIEKRGSLCGSLRNFGLPDIFIGLQRSLRTGTLEISERPELKKVYISKGDMVYATSNMNSDGLGGMLQSEGRIKKDALEALLARTKETGRPEGALLVETGIIKPAELPEAVKRSIERIIESLFSLEGARFEFREGPLPTKEVITLKLSAANLIYRGLKKIASIERMKEDCPPDIDCPLDFSKNPLDLFQDVELGESDRKILSFVDGRTTIKEIIRMSHMDEEEALRSIYALIGTRILYVKSPGEAPSDISAEEVFKGPDDKAAEGLITKINDMHGNYFDLGYYGVLGVKDTATTDEIRRAYYRAAKEFHPDLHFRLPEDTKAKLHEIFSYITTSYNTLSHRERRKEYDGRIRASGTHSLTKEEMAELKFREGFSMLRKGLFSEAAQFFAEATYLEGLNPKYQFHYGASLLRLGKFKEAERALGRAVKEDGSNPDILAELGHVYLKLGFPLRAKKNLEKALSLDGGNKRALEGMELLKASEA